MDKIFPLQNTFGFHFHHKYYKIIPIEITEEEYQEVKKYSKKKDDNLETNSMSTVLSIIGWLIFVGGFIAGIISGIIEVEGGVYYKYTYTTFSIAIALAYWGISFISGTLFLGFAEIIKLLDNIKNK